MKIARGARQQWIEGGQLVFVVSSSVGADRLLDAVRALERPLLSVGDEDDPGPKFMSDPAAVPGGVVFWLDAPDISETRLNEVLEVIAAVIDVIAPDARLSAPTAKLPFEGDEPSATLYLVAVPGSAEAPVPPGWIPVALEWAAQGFLTVVADASGAVEVSVRDAAGLVGAWLRGGAYAATLASRHDGVARWAEFHRSHDGLPARLALAESGHHLEHTLDEVFDTLVALGRQRGDDTVWAFADVALHGGWSRWLNISRQEDWLQVGDYILGVHPWQRLGSGPPRPSRAPPRRGEAGALRGAGRVAAAPLGRPLRDGGRAGAARRARFLRPAFRPPTAATRRTTAASAGRRLRA